MAHMVPPLCTLNTHHLIVGMYMGVSQNRGYHFGGPYNKDSIWGSIFGSPIKGNYVYLGCFKPIHNILEFAMIS